NALNNTATGIKVKQSSTNVNSGYSDLGGTFSSVTFGDNYYVLKGNNTALPDVGYLAIYDPSGSDIGSKGSVAGSQLIYSAGDTSSVSNAVGNVICYYQGLSTTQKQW